MDLEAYMQIPGLEKIVEDNNIKIPRVRGYSLMKYEDPVSEEEIKSLMKRLEYTICEKLCFSVPFWNADSGCSEYSLERDSLCKHYLVSNVTEEDYIEYTGIRWDRIHGWKRKVLKFEIKKQKRKFQKFIDMHNKYAGNKNILRIHARIGGSNWDCFGGNDLINQPWFLDKVDDYFDETYCDIYASIK